MNDSADLPAALPPAAAQSAAQRATLARPGFVLATALLTGCGVDALLHGQPLGFGYALAALLAAAACLALARGLGRWPSRSAWLLLAAFVLVSLSVAWRASPTLQAVDVLGGVGLLLLMSVVYLPGGLPGMGIGDYVAGLFVSSIATMVQPLIYGVDDLPRLWRRRSARAAGPATLAPVAWGLILAVPVLLVFGALFASADPVFAYYLRRIFDWQIDLGEFVARLVVSLALAWLALGLVRHAFLGRLHWDVKLARRDGFALGAVQAITLLALLNALFAAFVIIQTAYLFGGVDTLARVGLTHSEYARRGFFELVAVAALVLGLVLLLDWLVLPGAGRSRRAVDTLHTLLIAFTLVVLASAVYRMQIYVLAYGLTELRLYTLVFMGWLALVLLVLAATLLPFGRPARGYFTFVALVAGLLIWLGTNAANPDARIAQANLNRAARIDPDRLTACVDTNSYRSSLNTPSGPQASTCLDVDYLAHLSADAVPTLAAGMEEQVPNACVRSALARALQARSERLDEAGRVRDWRGATAGELAARAALAASRQAREAAIAACPAGR